MPFHDNGLLFLTTSLVIQIYDLEHDSRCERQTGFALKCFRRHMLLKICSKCEILLKCCPKCEKVLKGAQNAKKCSKLTKSAQKVLSAIGKGLLPTSDFRLPTFEVGSWKSEVGSGKSEDPPRFSHFLDFTFCFPTQATRCYSRESFLSHSALFSCIQDIIN